LFGLLFTLSCSDSSSGTSAAKTFTIKYPSVEERTFGEKSDFYVIGLFDGVQVPGNIRIELFKGETASGTPVRTLESRVDDETGVTPRSSILPYYPYGVAYHLDMAPDLVIDPGGFYYPGNKVLVTKDYYGGIILGGSTKRFDTDYTDAAGNPLEDLTEGVYTLKVTGLSGDISSYSETIQVYFKPIRKLFGGFQPANHKDKFFAYAEEHGYRKLYDPLPGYFSPISWDNCYKIEKRARPQNSLEVVNTVDGATCGTPENAMIGFILYNLKGDGATSRLEIGKALLTEVIDNPNTYFYYYNIGEPDITYKTMEEETKTIQGSITLFDYGDRLVLTRASIKVLGTGDGDNKYNINDPTPKTLDLDLSDGIQLTTSEEFGVFGVVTPIPAGVTDDPDQYLYYIADNWIDKVRYHIKDAQGQEILTTTRNVTLEREYFKSDPIQWFPSVYEFEHEFNLNLDPGTYTVELIALDRNGDEVSGSAETFTVEYR
ncbi:MAG: hypothetical protein H8E10_16975, partial [Desulfobacterales bacterium]|nr:hypothetical protein [Desulfobacterales bacterium]